MIEKWNVLYTCTQIEKDMLNPTYKNKENVAEIVRYKF